MFEWLIALSSATAHRRPAPRPHPAARFAEVTTAALRRIILGLHNGLIMLARSVALDAAGVCWLTALRGRPALSLDGRPALNYELVCGGRRRHLVILL